MKLITHRAVTFFFNGVITELFTTKFFVLLMNLFIIEDAESCMRSMQMTSIFGRVVCWKCWRAVKYDLLISCCGCATLKELSRIAFFHNIHLIIFDVYCGSWKMALMMVTLRIVKDMRPPWWFVYKSVVINMDGLNENLSAQQTRTTYSQTKQYRDHIHIVWSSSCIVAIIMKMFIIITVLLSVCIFLVFSYFKIDR